MTARPVRLAVCEDFYVSDLHVIADCRECQRLRAEQQAKCRHKFVDSPHCLKCGWEPNRA